MMEHRLMELGFSLVEIKDMSSHEVIDRYGCLSYLDEKKSKSREEATEEWSHLALTK